MNLNLNNYIKGMLSSFKRDKITDSIVGTRQMLTQHTIPSYEDAAALFADRNFKSKNMRRFVTIYSANIDKVIDSKFLPGILGSLNNTVTLLDYIDQITRQEFSDTEASLTMTYRKSTFLRLIQTAEFVSAYARKFVNYVFVLETAEASEHFSLKDRILEIEIDYLENNYANFVQCLRVLNTTKDHLRTAVNVLPDAVITDASELSLPETLGPAKLDPLRMQALTVTWNPFYLLGMWNASDQAESYKEAELEMQMIQLRKNHLQSIYAGNPDPRLEKQIVSLENRLQKLQYTIQKRNEEYGLK